MSPMASTTPSNSLPPSSTPSLHINPLIPSQGANQQKTSLAHRSPADIPLPPLPAPYLPIANSYTPPKVVDPVTYSTQTLPILNYPQISPTIPPTRKQAQHSSIAKSVMTGPAMIRSSSAGGVLQSNGHLLPPGAKDKTLANGGVGVALSDTPDTTAPNSPRLAATPSSPRM